MTITFVFTRVVSAGSDVVPDFGSRADRLQFDDALWTGTPTAQQVVDGFATLAGITALTGLAATIDIIRPGQHSTPGEPWVAPFPGHVRSVQGRHRGANALAPPRVACAVPDAAPEPDGRQEQHRNGDAGNNACRGHQHTKARTPGK